MAGAHLEVPGAAAVFDDGGGAWRRQEAVSAELSGFLLLGTLSLDDGPPMGHLAVEPPGGAQGDKEGEGKDAVLDPAAGGRLFFFGLVEDGAEVDDLKLLGEGEDAEPREE